MNPPRLNEPLRPQGNPPLATILLELAQAYERLGLNRKRALASARADFAEELRASLPEARAAA
jgi:hypothetical protein